MRKETLDFCNKFNAACNNLIDLLDKCLTMLPDKKDKKEILDMVENMFDEIFSNLREQYL